MSRTKTTTTKRPRAKMAKTNTATATKVTAAVVTTAKSSKTTAAKTKTSQTEKVRNLLAEGKKLTQHGAKSRYGISSLSSRVNELRKTGMRIESERIRVRRDGETRSVVQYAAR